MDTSDLLDAEQYQKLTGKTYKQQRGMRGKGLGRWQKDGRKYKILVLQEDIIPGVPNEAAGFGAPKPAPADPNQPELPGGEDTEDWKLRKLRAEALFKEQQNDAFLFKLLNDFLTMFANASAESLQPVRKALLETELDEAAATRLNDAWDRYEREFAERADRETQLLFDKLMGVK